MVETCYTVPGAPELALLTDFHNGNPLPVLRSLERRKPQLICIAGDVVFDGGVDWDAVLDQEENILPLLRGCVDIAPTFLSLGNHECIVGVRDLARIAGIGVTVLDNQWTSRGGYVVGGLTSCMVLDLRAYLSLHPGPLPKPRTRERRDHWQTIKKPDTAWLSTAPEGYRVLLCHHPEYYPLIPEDVDLILCGHAHGGQWRLFGHGVYAPGQGFWPRWTAGVAESRMVISRGLHNTTWVPRLFNPTEIVYIHG